MSFWSDDGLPPFDHASGVRLCDMVYAGIVYRRQHPELERRAPRSIRDLDFHDETEFRMAFRPQGGEYEIYHPEVGKIPCACQARP